MNCTQSSVDRIEQLEMWITSKLVAIEKLVEKTEELSSFNHEHNMVIHGLSDKVIDPLKLITDKLANEVEKHQLELDKLMEVTK